ncbi:MAG: hypothetical protein QM790_04365 [Nibricoccus sp.]
MSIIARAVLLLPLAIVIIGCSPKKSSPKPADADPATAANDFKTHWQTESWYFVENISHDVFVMAAYAHKGPSLRLDHVKFAAEPVKPADREVLKFRIVAQIDDEPELETSIAIKDDIFSPDVYASFAREVLKKLQVNLTATTEDTDSLALLQALTEPTSKRIASEEMALSSEMESHLLSPRQHEKAALLLAAFTLREHSGIFFQTRAELSRMAAHLAFASALRASRAPSTEGTIAEAAFATLLNKQTEALHQLDSITNNEPCVAAWKNALRLRITNDYRIQLTPAATLLERIEKFRAEAESADAVVAFQHAKDDMALISDTAWYHIVYEQCSSVQIGHQLHRLALPMDMQEAGEVCKRVTGKKINSSSLDELLNCEPENTFLTTSGTKSTVHIIGWGHWAGFFQRHLCHTLKSDFSFLQDSWGVPEEAAKFQQMADRVFSQMRLYPFVKRHNAVEPAYYHQAQKESMEVVRSHPHLVPSEAWNQICYYPHREAGAIYIPPPHAFVNEWHRLNPQPGAPYDIEPRMNQPSLTGRPDYSAVLAALHAAAPYSVSITHYYLLDIAKKNGRKTATYQEMERGYGSVADYNSAVAAAIADAAADAPTVREKWLTTAASIDPGVYFALGQFYTARKEDDKAAHAYEKGFELDDDDVLKSNNASWLVKYYEQHGERTKAEQLAEFAAETYSYLGLEAKALLLESRGDLAGALDIYQKIEERYEDRECMLSFLIRINERNASPSMRSLFLAKAKAVFPHGLEKIDLTKLTEPPITGIKLRGESPLTREFGVKSSDIIVGVRGIRVENIKAFVAVRDSQPNTPYTLCLWRDNRYMEITASPPNNRFGVELDDYRR